jgi:hypothetical protein
MRVIFKNKNDIFCAGVQHPHVKLSKIYNTHHFLQKTITMKEVFAGAVSFAKEFQTLFSQDSKQ